MKILIALLFPVMAHAQYDGPGVEVCRLYAQRQLMRDANTARGIVIERDANLVIERYTRKVGNQFVSSILTGNGAVVFANAPSAELAFICLLADDKRAVFFEWLPRRDASALAQCTRDDTTRANPRSCLQTLLEVTEADLTQAYAGKLTEARDLDVAAGNEEPSDRFRASNKAWLQYRDAECLRRKDQTPAGVDPGDYQLACIVELSRRRLVDAR
ncbi:MAG TPA: lysozyme inhibitor LprI family protein [Burkholderiales bacterium]|nr:lysozyme inhibitor LprI family protein [Burkholderiales bacterium]